MHMVDEVKVRTDKLSKYLTNCKRIYDIDISFLNGLKFINTSTDGVALTKDSLTLPIEKIDELNKAAKDKLLDIRDLIEESFYKAEKILNKELRFAIEEENFNLELELKGKKPSSLIYVNRK